MRIAVLLCVSVASASAVAQPVADVDVGFAVVGERNVTYGDGAIGASASVAAGASLSPRVLLLARLRGSFLSRQYGEYWKGSLGASVIYRFTHAWVSGELGVAVIGNDGAHCYTNKSGVGGHFALGAGLPVSQHTALVFDGMASTIGDVQLVFGVRWTWY